MKENKGEGRNDKRNKERTEGKMKAHTSFNHIS